LLPKRSWSNAQLRQAVGLALQQELVTCLGDKVRLTKKGRVEAERLTREHRLWELYLITEADIAPSRVDREADRIEHVLEPEIVAELEAILTGENRSVPESPHDLRPVEPGAAGSDPQQIRRSTADQEAQR
jgi:manganese/zinc/iron transport system permease protein